MRDQNRYAAWTARLRPRMALGWMTCLLTILSTCIVHGHDEHAREQVCARIVSKLASVHASDCRSTVFITAGHSVDNSPILVKEYPPLPHRRPQARILLLGGTHGDEYSSISIVFHWMRILDTLHSGLFHWLVMPLLNPDGLLREQSTRTNSRGVDINRNMPSSEWHTQGMNRWIQRANSLPRYYPGSEPASEPETRTLVKIIEHFKPDAIISVHAPLDLVDYDGPGQPPKRLGSLSLRRLGNFPGTLGHYIGHQAGIPVVTIELASSGRMPSEYEISAIWSDLLRWLVDHVPVVRDERHEQPPVLAEGAEAIDVAGGR